MNDRICVDLAMHSLQMEMDRLEANRGKLNESDKAEIRIIMARLNSLVCEKRAAA